jgi:hypothetical protein
VKHYDGCVRLGAGIHMGLSDERHEQVCSHRAARCATTRRSQGEGKRSRSHHADGPESSGGGHGAGELAARDATGHAGLDHGALDAKLVDEAGGTRRSHLADATCRMTLQTAAGRSWKRAVRASREVIVLRYRVTI